LNNKKSTLSNRGAFLFVRGLTRLSQKFLKAKLSCFGWTPLYLQKTFCANEDKHAELFFDKRVSPICDEF
jgi:hypothetical protein